MQALDLIAAHPVAAWLLLYVLVFMVLALINGEFSNRLVRWLTAWDILLFSLATFGRARRNETISAAAWSLELDGKWQGRVFRPFIDWALSPLEKDHCHVSWLAEKDHYQQ